MEITRNEDSPKSGAGWKAFAIAGALIGMAAANAWMFQRGSKLEAEIVMLRSALATEIADLKDTANTQAVSTKKSLTDMNQQIQTTQSGAQRVAAAHASQAKAMAEKAVKQTEALVASLADKQKAQQEEVSQQIGAVKQAAEANTAKVGEVATEIGAVKSEVASTRSQLETTIAELKSVRGDLGVQSGLIATNANELTALRELGERNYYEFDLRKKSPVFKAVGVAVSFRKVDLRRNRFHIDLMADDRRIEKKDKTLNEPVQFYVAGARQPYEIVVNQISKDRLVGYLSTPKVMQARR